MHLHQSGLHVNGLRDRSSESPLDFSSATTGGGFSSWSDACDVGSMLIGGDDDMKHFTSLTSNANVKRVIAESPDYRFVVLT